MKTGEFGRFCGGEGAQAVLFKKFSSGTGFSLIKTVDTRATLMYNLIELKKSVWRSFMMMQS
ncbi:MAG: hypothetical protein R3F41_00450 [Gammaproteobacteria bacterium]|nr:hypothetical protein [Pseudomonadales bacterium]